MAPRSDTPSGTWPTLALALCVAGVLTFAALWYFMPETYASGWGLYPKGLRHFERHWFGRSATPLSAESFTLAIRLALAVAWSGYALAIVAGLRGSLPNGGLLRMLIVGLAIILALFFPPCLSGDIYSYVGEARLYAVHGLSPYSHPPSTLLELGELDAEFFTRAQPSAYGPAWLLLTSAMVALMPGAALWYQVLALKLLAAAALIVAALLGRAIAEQLSPGRGEFTLLAIGLNPLFLIEGPGNGHSDFLLMSLCLFAAWMCLKNQYAAGILVMGLATAVKFTPVVVGPWLILEWTRGHALTGKLGRTVAAAVLLLAPTALAFAPLAGGADLMSTLHAQTERGHKADDQATARPAFVVRQAPVIVCYLALTVWLTLRPAPGNWLAAWSIFALVLVTVTGGGWYPWYLVWPWSVALTRWDRLGLYPTAICFALALKLTWLYSCVWD